MSRTCQSGVTGHKVFKGINIHYIIQIGGWKVLSWFSPKLRLVQSNLVDTCTVKCSV